MNKNDLRKEYKAKRAALSEEQIDELSLNVANKVLLLPIWEKTYFHLFLPITEFQEVNTEYILHLLSGKDKEIVISKSDFISRKMTHYLLTDSTKIKKNIYNIPEPQNGIEVPIEKIEVVFVPLLAYDIFGNRVGYGKGFYDTFLSECNSETIKIGLSFFPAVDAIHDIFESDIQLDFCVSPDFIYSF